MGTRPKQKKGEYHKIEEELSKWDAAYSIELTSKHTKVYIEKWNKKRLVVISASPSDARALKNQICDIRRNMALIGAARHG